MIPVVRNLPCHITVRSFRNCPWDEIRETLNTAPWQVMDIYNDINDMWLFFNSIIQNCLDTYVPTHQVTSKFSKRHTPWLTFSILSVIKLKKKAKRLADSTHSTDDIASYKRLKNQLKIYVREAKLSYLQMLLHQAKKDPQPSVQLWSGINNVIGCCKSQNGGISNSLSLEINNFSRNIAISPDHQSASHFVPPTYIVLVMTQFLNFLKLKFLLYL